MLMHEALRIINDEPKPMGYMVSFERKEGRFLTSDYFPDKHRGEPLIPTEEEALVLAQKFAARTIGKCVNVYVVAHDFAPVPGYETRKIENRLWMDAARYRWLRARHEDNNCNDWHVMARHGEIASVDLDAEIDEAMNKTPKLAGRKNEK